MKISVDFKVNREKLDTLAKSTQGIADRVMSEVSAEIVQIAKSRSRVLSGDMQRGWNRSRIGKGSRGGYRIYNTMPYTVWHEFGSSKMSPQPMLGPAMAEVQGSIPRRVAKWIEIGTRQVVDESGDSVELTDMAV